MSSCVIREKRCCAPSDCMPQTKKVIVNPIKIKHIPTYKEYLESELRIIELEIKKNERILKFIENNINKITKGKDRIKAYDELQTITYPIYIEHNLNNKIDSIKSTNSL